MIFLHLLDDCKTKQKLPNQILAKSIDFANYSCRLIIDSKERRDFYILEGVLIPHTALLNRLQWQWRELPYADNEKYCIFKTSLTFVDSVPEIWSPLLQGLTLVVVPKSVTKDPEKFVPLLEKHQVTLHRITDNNSYLS